MCYLGKTWKPQKYLYGKDTIETQFLKIVNRAKPNNDTNDCLKTGNHRQLDFKNYCTFFL